MRAVNEGDVVFAAASNAVIIGFNVRPDRNAAAMAEREQIDIRLHRVIYDVTEEIKQAIEIQLGIWAVTVEHVGSTAVPGLAAKPIIDLDIVIASETDLPRVIFLLGELGYVHLGDLGIDGREAFGRPTSDIPRLGESRQWFSHHLYVEKTVWFAFDNSYISALQQLTRLLVHHRYLDIYQFFYSGILQILPQKHLHQK